MTYIKGLPPLSYIKLRQRIEINDRYEYEFLYQFI